MTLSAPATVYGRDEQGEFVYGVEEVAEGAAQATDPFVKKLYAEAAAASLHFRDQLIADIPEQTIKGFAAMAAALGYIVTEHKKAKRTSAPSITYAALFRILCGPEPCTTISLAADDATLALLSKSIEHRAGWLCVSEIHGMGNPQTKSISPYAKPNQVVLNIDGNSQVLRAKTTFRGTVPDTDNQFMLIVEHPSSSPGTNINRMTGVGLVYRECDEIAVIGYVTELLRNANPFKNRIVLMNRDVRTVRSRISERGWSHIIPHVHARQELDFIAAAIRDKEMLKAEGLTLRRGLLLSGPPGDGKSTAIECFVNSIAGEATVLIVEAVDHLRWVYDLAQRLGPAVVILEDLDLMTKARQNPYMAATKDDVTGELLQVLSGSSSYPDVVTIATTNRPEAIDEALSKRAGRFDAHIRMGYPTSEEKEQILMLYLDKFSVSDEFTRARLGQILSNDLAKLHLVPAHIEEFVKAGVKRARLARREPQFQDFEPGIESTRSIASIKPAA
jgi:AAA+ superfamily predicted ATPase